MTMQIQTFRSFPTTDPPSTNAFVDVKIGEVKNLTDYLTAWSSGPISLHWKNTGSDTIAYQILGSNELGMADGDKKVVASGTIAAGVSAHIEIPLAYYQFYEFQQKSNVADTPGASLIRGRFGAI